MKSFKRLLLAAALTVGFSAQAGIHLEPYLGYAVSGEYNSGGTTKPDYTGGPLLGARVGYGMMGLFVAGDYQMGTLTRDSTPEADFDESHLGISVGYEFPILLRIYGTYFLAAEAETTGSTLKGTGTKVGIGYTGLPFLALNFEMHQYSYDEVNGINLSSDLETQYYAISLSLPLGL